MGTRTTREVVERHLALRAADDLERDLRENYAEDVRWLGPCGALRGHDALRVGAARLAEDVPGLRFEVKRLLVDGDVALLEWRGDGERGVRVEDGADTFVVRDGRIVAQTVHYTPTRRG